MRVLTCHHFAYQEVFTTDYEPQTLYAADDKIFVATSQCYIEVHTLAKHGCPLITKFPTIGTVLQLKYSKADNFIATLEDKNAKSPSGNRAVRVYLNWPTEPSHPQPMRARIAGYMTSLRHIDKQNGEKRFEVVEIPLKEKPNCIAADESNGTLAIGVGCAVLVYGFCSKNVADSPWRYEDMKLLLELKFSFLIDQISISEEFIACSSKRQLQVVMLHTDNQELSKSKTGDGKLDKLENGLKTKEVEKNLVTVTKDPKIEIQDSEKKQDSIPNQVADEKIEEDIRHRHDDPVYMTSHKAPRFGRKSKHKHHDPAKAAKRKLEEQLRKNGEIYGPLLKTPNECHVSVEYEDTCELGDSLKYLHNSVSTYMYRIFDPAEHVSLHSLQLLPICKSTEGQDETPKKCCATCNTCSRKEHPIRGMYCFISTPLEGYLFKIFHKPEPLVTVPYTAPSKQVCCTLGMLYVLTETGIEVYSSRCTAAALHESNSYDGVHRTLPSPKMEVCLLGLHPFIGPQMAAFSSCFLVLFSKHIYEGEGTTEINWSIYSVRTPKTLVLYNDMKELIERYHQTAVPSSDITHLLKEAHLAIEGSILLCDLPEGPQYLLEVCNNLVAHLSRPVCEDWNLTLPYFMMSGMTLNQFLKVITEAAKKCQLRPPYGKGAMQVLNHVLFSNGCEIDLDREEENKIVDIFSQCEGVRLSELLTLTCLKNYDSGNALTKLKQWISSCMMSSMQKTIALDHLCLMTLHSQVGNTKDAEAILTEMPKDDIIETCIKYPQLLHNDYQTFHPLACFMWDQRRSVFLDIITRWIQDGVMTLERISKLIENYSTNSGRTSMKRMLLEHILSVSGCESLYKESSITLAVLYVEALQSENEPLAVKEIPNGGHFAERFQWLQSLETLCEDGSTSNSHDIDNTGVLAVQKGIIRRNLESLLCSSHTTNNLIESVLDCLQTSNDLKSSLVSVVLLCDAEHNPQTALEKILDDYPSIACQYIREMTAGVETIDMLKYSLPKVAETIQSLDNHKDSHEEVDKFTDVYKELLDFSAKLLDTKSLLQLLPPDASAGFCLPYLRKALDLNQDSVDPENSPKQTMQSLLTSQNV